MQDIMQPLLCSHFFFKYIGKMVEKLLFLDYNYIIYYFVYYNSRFEFLILYIVCIIMFC